MHLDTRNFGEIEIDEDLIFHFPEGVPGFEETKNYIVLNSEDDSNPFQWLQSVDNPSLAFVIIDPRIIKSDYVVEVDDEKVSVLKVQDADNVMTYIVVVVPENVNQMTANFKAPILMNSENKLGKQVILDNPEYHVRHYILEEIRKTGGKK